MSDQPQGNKFQVQIHFPYIKGNIPTYSNTVLVSPSPEGVFIDFGFFDPFFGRQIQEKILEAGSTEQREIEPVEVEVVGRFVITRTAAEDLIQQIQATLDTLK